MLTSVGVAYAYYNISSNRVYAQIEYNLVLIVESQSGSNVVLLATLKDKTSPVIDVAVKFYMSTTGEPNSYSLVETKYTDTSGNARITYSAIVNGYYYFIATYDVP